MAARRGRAAQRNVPWDSSNPANWTIQQLRDELESKFEIYVPTSMSKSTLRALYLETAGRRREAAPVSSRRSATAVRDAGNTENGSRLITSPTSHVNLAGNSGNSVVQNDSTEDSRGLLSAAETQELHSQQSATAQADRSTPNARNITTPTQTNMAAPTSVMQGMLSTVQTLQQTVQSMQQAMITLISQRNTPSITPTPAPNNLEAAYAAMTARTTGSSSRTTTHADPEVSTASSYGQSQPLSSSPTGDGALGLDQVINSLWTAAIAPSTRQAYTTGFNVYIRFLIMAGILMNASFSDVPVSEDLLLSFVAHCFSALELSYSTIKLYMCGIRFICLEKNINHPSSSELPRVHAILNGVKRRQVRRTASRHPVTFSVLKQVCEYFRKQPTDLMLETACTIAFFGFLRCGEFTVKGHFDPSIDLCINDLVLSTECALLTLKQSKTDPFREGITIKLFSTGKSICPYDICCKFLKQRMESGPSASDPLFVNDQGLILTRTLFISKFRHALECVGINSNKYNGHSFRIGAATTAAQANIEDHMIKTLGRWSSDAYCRYIRTSTSSIKNAQRSLIIG
ncbi:uncharacterized protein LOC117325109 [Pecten maximus]|uniref:uncharacterized protein LOC117325109 n=1 Tax=Pecten maximus TaxID=6579 RepID=UPI0014582947|nr:uncharacterized protein LOC117325109 [Pecten maximus]